MPNQLPIGIFDSGMGGLTVLRALKNSLPNESFVYLGDTARLPYGTKSSETVQRYAIQMAKILEAYQIKLMVVACNTASTTALNYLKKMLPDIPIVGVIEPGAHIAITKTRNFHIAVLATETTIRSGCYEKTLQRLNPKVKVLNQSCGLFVALAEEGCIDDEVAVSAVKKYLRPIISSSEKYDCILLGCTHFPVLIKPIQKILGNDVIIVDSATATADSVKTILTELNLLNPNIDQVEMKFLVTDLPERFARVGEIFYGQAINENLVELIETNGDPIKFDKKYLNIENPYKN